jgi:Tol biopolymer transport system component
MALTPGTRLGAYEVLSALGAGGMGEVYRARDTKLGRDVALKILPDSFAQDRERLARFQREAQVLASLNHQHIGAIFGLEESSGVSALVLELIAGPTLADRIAEGAIPLPEALVIARQIAEALEAAHEQGVIHRDLKPANIKLRPDGTVKVLDFGLAKLVEAPVVHGGGLSQSPTISAPAMTGIGSILGTAAYMSPEQAKGRAVDKRGDVWAFGCVVYEMLTGSRPFIGEDVTGTMAAILERQPSWERLPAATPAPIRRLLLRSLEKDPRRRLHSIADARLEIEDALAPQATGRAVVDPRLRRSIAFGILLAVILTALTTGTLVWLLKPSAAAVPAARDTVRFNITPPAPLAVAEGFVAVSPDGRQVAYGAGDAASQQLFVHDIGRFDSRVVPGTDGVVDAAFSPDGQSIVFIADRKLKRVALAGGTPRTLRESVDGAGLNWTPDQNILFNPGLATGIWRIPADGGMPTVVTIAGGKDNNHRFPEMLPNGKGVLFSGGGGVSENQIYVQSLTSGQRRALVHGVAPHYLPTGHLTYVEGGTLFAVRFDLERLDVTGSAVALVEGIKQARTSAPLLSFSRVGSMAYVPTVAGAGSNTLVWVDHAGVEQPAPASGRLYAQPRLAPDGTRVVASLRGDSEDLWLYDLRREAWNRLTFEAKSSFPLWTPDGRRLTYSSGKDGPYNIFWRPVDGSASEERLLAGDRPNYPFSWSPDGRVLAFVSVNSTTFQDIWVLDVHDKSKPRPFLETQFREGAPTFSPDGRWLAYVSDESGRNEIYVRPFPGPGEKWAISTEGGNEPVWPRNGRQIFYRTGDAMMAVDVETTPTFSAGKPRRLFEKPFERSIAFWPNYDVSADGQRLLMIKNVDQTAAPNRLSVVLNWDEDLKQRVPAK